MPVENVAAQFAPRIVNPLDIQNALAQAGQNQLAMQHTRMQLQQMQADQEDTNALRAAYRGGADPSTAEGRQALIQAAPLQAPKIFQQQADLEKSRAESEKFRGQGAEASSKAKASNLELASRDWAAIDPNNDQQVAAVIAKHVKSGLLDPDAAQAMADRLTTEAPAGTPARMDWYHQQGLQGLSMQQRAENAQRAQDEAGRNTRNAADIQGRADTNAANIKKDYGVAGMQQAGENSRAALGRQTQLTVAGMGPGGQEEGISPAAIENAASRYNLDGTLPPMGMGASGAAGRRAILNRAAELAIGTSGTQQRINQMDAKSAGAALTQLTKSKTMASSFEKTANANADLALGLSDKLDRTGIPLLNAGIQALRTGTGSPEATQFAAAISTFTGEYAKIMSGGMGNGPTSDAARNKAESLLTSKMTPEQFKGNVQLLKTEMRNRMNGFDSEEQALRSRLGGQTPDAAPAPASKVVHFGDLK